MSTQTSAEHDAGTAIEHTAVRQLAGRTFGPPLVKKIYLPLPITPTGPGKERLRDMAGKKLVSELRPGDRVDSYFSVAYKKPVVEYANGWMFEFRVGDRSGQATAKYWGGRDRELVKGVHDSFNRDDVVHITGEAKEYRGQMEIAVSEKDGGTVRRLGDGEFDVRELIRARQDIPEMTAKLAEVVRSVREPHLRKLLDSFASDEEFMEGFRSAPASIQLHAAAIGGLLHHTLNVVSLCEKMCELHPDLDRDLVVTAALLHDIGKVASFKVTSNITQTPEGNLLGHIVMGDQELTMRMNAIEGFPDMLALKLRHVLLAHHGKRDWGSPVEPMLPEALAVHMADDVDAKLDYMTTQLSEAVTEDDWIWDRRLQRLLYLR